MSKSRILLAGIALSVASIGVFAQPATPRVDQREANQQARIDQGVASGQLTPKETKRLEKQQTHIAKAETNAKADGVVTAKEHRHLNGMQDRASRDIHREKHDRQVAPKS